MAVFTESFTGIDDVALSDSLTADLAWTSVDPGSNQNWAHVSDQASPRGTSRGITNYARAEHDTDSSDQYAQYVVATLNAVATNQTGPCVRFQPAANDSYMAMVDGDGTVTIRKTIAGSRTDIGTAVTVDITGLPKVLRTEVEGSTIRAFWDGVLVDEVTDTDIASGTRAGLYGHEASNSEALGVIVDDFEVGDLAAAGTVTLAAHAIQITHQSLSVTAAGSATVTLGSHAVSITHQPLSVTAAGQSTVTLSSHAVEITHQPLSVLSAGATVQLAAHAIEVTHHTLTVTAVGTVTVTLADHAIILDHRPLTTTATGAATVTLAAHQVQLTHQQLAVFDPANLARSVVEVPGHHDLIATASGTHVLTVAAAGLFQLLATAGGTHDLAATASGQHDPIVTADGRFPE